MAIGVVAIAGLSCGFVAVGLADAIGGLALAPSVIDGTRCDPDTVELVRRWFGSGTLPPPFR